MNNQEAFDKMATHLLTQKVQARNDIGQCRYRTEESKMCAVGALIPDNEYNVVFENQSIRAIADQIPSLMNVSIELLSRAQMIHDTQQPKNWFNNLQELAKDWGLKTTILANFTKEATNEQPGSVQ